MLNYKKILLIATSSLSIVSCASNTQPNSIKLNQKQIDPYERFNRKVFIFNSYLDGYFFRPITIGYIATVPKPIQISIENIFVNLKDFVSLGNAVLQLRIKDSFSQLMRVSLNTTIGIFGILDVAGSIGLASQKITFGDTIRQYGWNHSSYIVAPFFGPSTVRDFLGTGPNIFFNPTWYIFDNNYISIGLFFTNSIQQRAKLLGYDQLLVTSLDPYIAVRDYYLKSINDFPIETEDYNNVSIDDLIK
jgi:phospholipid-binding lipoprotein MlaA